MHKYKYYLCIKAEILFFNTSFTGFKLGWGQVKNTSLSRAQLYFWFSLTMSKVQVKTIHIQ